MEIILPTPKDMSVLARLKPKTHGNCAPKIESPNDADQLTGTAMEIMAARA